MVLQHIFDPPRVTPSRESGHLHQCRPRSLHTYILPIRFCILLGGVLQNRRARDFESVRLTLMSIPIAYGGMLHLVGRVIQPPRSV
jgi:hypothetical protein